MDLTGEFHSVMADIRTEIVEVKEEIAPAVSAVAEEKEPRKDYLGEDLFVEVENPSKSSLFVNWNINEVSNFQLGWGGRVIGDFNC